MMVIERVIGPEGVESTTSKPIGVHQYMLEWNTRETRRNLQVEKVVETEEASFDKVGDCEIRHTVSRRNQLGRIVVFQRGKEVPVASLIHKKMNGNRIAFNMMVDEEFRRYGVATWMLEAFKRRFGYLRIMGPYSPFGAKAANRFPDAIEVIV